jgi:uncharacterized membrane protein
MDEFTNHIILPGLLIGGIFLLVGGIMYYFPPKKPNYFYGYRTPSSMKSQECWDFAQKFSAVKLIEGGASVMMLSLVIGYITSPAATGPIVLILLLGIILRLFITTEQAIKNQFKN